MVHDLTVSSWFSLRHLSDHDNPKPLLCKILGHKKHWINEITCKSLFAKIRIFRCDRESSYFLEVREEFHSGPEEHHLLQIKKLTYHAIDQIMNDWDGSLSSFKTCVIDIGKILSFNLQWIHLGFVTSLSYLFQKYGEPAYEQYQKTGGAEVI